MGRLSGDLETRDEGLGDIKYGTRGLWDGDAGDAGTLMKISLKYLFLRKNVLFMVNIRFHRLELLWTPYDVSLSSMQGGFANSSLRKQAWKNHKEGRVGCLHQNILTRKVIDLPPNFAIIIHIPRSCMYLTSRVPVPHVLASIFNAPWSPHKRPNVLHSPTFAYGWLGKYLIGRLKGDVSKALKSFWRYF